MHALSLLLRYNARSLSLRGADAALTVVGLALAAAVLVVILALRQGIQDAFAPTGSAKVAVFVRRGATAETHGGVSPEAARVVETLPGVAGSSPELVVLANVERRDGRPSNVLVRGMNPQGLALRPGFELVRGRLPDPRCAEVMVGRSVSERFRTLGLGETFGKGKLALRVVGVFEAPGASGSEVWGPLASVQQAYGREGKLSSIRVRLDPALAPSEALARIERAVANDPRLPLGVALETDWLASQEGSASEIPRAMGEVLAVLLAVGAGFGTMNTLFARVAARTREIATLRALGFGSGPIVSAFLGEALLLALVGGVLGVLAGALVHGETSTTASLATLSEVAFRFRVTPASILGGLGLALAAGLAGGALPALRAARVDIAQACRA